MQMLEQENIFSSIDVVYLKILLEFQIPPLEG